MPAIGFYTKSSVFAVRSAAEIRCLYDGRFIAGRFLDDRVSTGVEFFNRFLRFLRVVEARDVEQGVPLVDQRQLRAADDQS